MGNGVEFFQTVMGRRFYEHDVPRMADAMESIAKELKRSNDLKDKEREEAVERIKLGLPPKGK